MSNGTLPQPPISTHGVVSEREYNNVLQECGKLRVLVETKDFGTHMGGQITSYDNPQYSYHIALNIKRGTLRLRVKLEA